MKNIYVAIILSLICSFGFAQEGIPHLNKGQLIVDGKPFIMIAGELHNSSASSIAYMDGLWPKLQNLNLNTVLATISWDQFEPKEGEYDYQMIDYLIENSRKNKLKLVVIWFASWKNGQSSYIPLWVKKDTKRFPRVRTKEGEQIETLSVFSNDSRNADARAFTALMKRIKEMDNNHTVIMVQPENEVGIFQDIDYSPEALKAFNREVPKDLINYLKKNNKLLKDEVKSVWQAAGNKTKGSWKEVFGDNPQSREFFMAWHYATYINYIAESGRRVLDLPMFVNAWIVQDPSDLPGVYPNGGPVSRVMDIYKAAGPALDVVCPDIYLPNYKEIYKMYHRADNPLLVPESSLDPARAFYAFAEHDAICFSPFGIEDADGDVLFSQSYAVLNQLQELITNYQGTGKMRGVHLTKAEQDRELSFGKLTVRLKIQDPNEPAFGLLIQTDEDEFIVSGLNYKVTFEEQSVDKITYVGSVIEGRFENGKWIYERWLNGDETYHHELVRVLGKRVQLSSEYKSMETDLNVADGEQFVYSPGNTSGILTPGIYKVTLYQRGK